MSIGKKSMSSDKINENFKSIYDEVLRKNRVI